MKHPDQVLMHLRLIEALRFEACSEAGTGWNGVGVGTVVVSEPADKVLVFEEAGIWQPTMGERQSIRFSNVFRWSAVGQVLRLEHLRFGAANPVLLFDMAADDREAWREVRPHECRHDRYAATLTVSGGQLLVTWSIIGPRKHETIRYTYW